MTSDFIKCLTLQYETKVNAIICLFKKNKQVLA